MTYCVIFGKPFKLGILNFLLRNYIHSFLSRALAFVKHAMSFLPYIKPASPGGWISVSKKEERKEEFSQMGLIYQLLIPLLS